MPHKNDPEAKAKQNLIESLEKEGWEYYPDADDWIREAAKSDNIHEGRGFERRQKIYHGDNYVYLAVSSVKHPRFRIFSQPKSDYFETTSEEGVCPNCQKYIRRYDDDDYLTCHRCGWQYTLSERLSNLLG